jgi:hypothetical protein
VGFLFARPGTNSSVEQLIKNLDYLDRRSGPHITIYWIGWVTSHDRSENVDAHSKHFDFDLDLFIRNTAYFENFLSWKYSGEIDLILIAISKDPNQGWKNVTIDFEDQICIDIKLQKAMSDKSIDSISGFFEDLFRFAKDYTGHQPIQEFAKEHMKKTVLYSILDVVLNFLPQSLRPTVRAMGHIMPKRLNEKKRLMMKSMRAKVVEK